MSIENIPEPYSEREIDNGKFVKNSEGIRYWGKEKQPFQKKWAIDAEGLIPNEINVIEKRRDISVMGFGNGFEEAYHSCLSKLEEKLDKRGWDFILIVNGVPLRNGANFQYHMSAILHKINHNYD